jgi:Tol biopolymer transport system component
MWFAFSRAHAMLRFYTPIYRVWLGLRIGMAIALLFALSSCGTARQLNLPFNPSDTSLNTPYSETEPYFASGRYLTFVSDRSGTPDVYLYDVQERRLVELPGLNSVDSVATHPRISDNGRYLVFAGNRQGKTDVYLYDRQMRVLKNLTQSLNADVRYPSISADGKTIAFESNAQGKWDIFLYNQSGRPIALPETSSMSVSHGITKDSVKGDFNP